MNGEAEELGAGGAFDAASGGNIACVGARIGAAVVNCGYKKVRKRKSEGMEKCVDRKVGVWF